MKIKTAFLATALALGVSHSALAVVKVGFMLPYSGTYTALGQAIENGFKMYVDEQGGSLGGEKIEFYRVDDESNPAKASDNANRLIKRDQVDVLVGTVHSGVAMALAKAAQDTDTTLIIPNAGADMLTGALCAPNVFRTSFTNWQPAYAMGHVAREKGYEKVVSVTWNYAAGKEAISGFKQGFEEEGGKVVKELLLPFPDVEFQSILTEIAALKPDAVFTFFAGGGAVKFVQDYASSGLGKEVPLLGSGFLTDGTLEAQGESAQGLLTTLHYADGLNTEKDNAFRASYSERHSNMAPDVYAVQGYDAAQLLDAGLAAVNGDKSNKTELRKAMRSATINSPRGTFTLSAAGNPIQDVYLREVQGKENIMISIAREKLEDPAVGCRL